MMTHSPSVRFNTWDQVTAFALTLPETELSAYYGEPAPKVNGKAFVSRSGELGSFHVRSPHDEKLVLIETDPATFWQTTQYANWPGLLIRLGSDDAERVRITIERAWWDAAKKGQRLVFRDRP